MTAFAYELPFRNRCDRRRDRRQAANSNGMDSSSHARHLGAKLGLSFPVIEKKESTDRFPTYFSHRGYKI